MTLVAGAVLAALTALLVSASGLAYSTGSYSGSTNRKGAVKFSVEGSQIKVFAISLPYRCTDGTSYRVTERFFNVKLRNGSFAERYTDWHGAGSWLLSGQLGEGVATGSLTGRIRFNRRNQHDRHGSVLCRTGTLTFTANPPASTVQPAQPPQPPAAPPPPPPAPQPPPVTDWTSVLIGHWFQQIPPMSADLWFFNDDPTAGIRTGSRSFCPYANECGLSPAPAAFIWQVRGDLLRIEFYGGITRTEYQIVGYNSATHTLTLSYNGAPTDLVRF